MTREERLKKSDDYEVINRLFINININDIYIKLTEPCKKIYDLLRKEYPLDTSLQQKLFVGFCGNLGISRRSVEHNLKILEEQRLIIRFRNQGKNYIFLTINLNEKTRLKLLSFLEFFKFFMIKKGGELKYKNDFKYYKLLLSISCFRQGIKDLKNKLGEKCTCFGEKCTCKNGLGEKCTRFGEKCTWFGEKCTRFGEKCTWAWNTLYQKLSINNLESEEGVYRLLALIFSGIEGDDLLALKRSGTDVKSLTEPKPNRLIYIIYLYIIYKARMGGIGGKGRKEDFKQENLDEEFISSFNSIEINLKILLKQLTKIYPNDLDLDPDINYEKLYSVCINWLMNNDNTIKVFDTVILNNLQTPILLDSLLDLSPSDLNSIINPNDIQI